MFKISLTLTNCVGVIDSGYRGEILAKFKTNTNVVPAVYKENERIMQMMILPYPEIEFAEVKELSESDRNTEGFGSTGNETNKDGSTSNTENTESTKE
jgi:dUTP pyrophosphatase